MFEHLRRHPDLYLPAAKEAPYFSHDGPYASDWREYLRVHFAFADPAPDGVLSRPSTWWEAFRAVR